MRFLSLYTARTMSGPPSAEHMAAMGKLIEEMMKDGTLIETGPLARAETGAFKATQADGKVDFVEGRRTQLTAASGYAILNVTSKEHLKEVSKRFLAIAGDGESDMIQIAEMGPPS
jgi:hypothetical protein